MTIEQSLLIKNESIEDATKEEFEKYIYRYRKFLEKRLHNLETDYKLYGQRKLNPLLDLEYYFDTKNSSFFYGITVVEESDLQKAIDEKMKIKNKKWQ